MSKQVWIIIIVIVACLSLLFYFTRTDEKYQWYENYNNDYKEPYGGYVIHKMAKTYFEKDTFVEMTKGISSYLKNEKDSLTNANYVFIGEALFLDSASKEDLLTFIYQGNNALICCKQIPDEFLYMLYDYQCGYNYQGFSYRADSVVFANFFHDSLKTKSPYKYSHKRRYGPTHYWWSYMNDDYLCDYSQTFTKLGYFKTENDSAFVNFMRVDYGKGHFYFHSTPLMFTNYYMIEESGVDYASGVFSHLPAGKTYWDEYNRMPHYMKQKQEGMHGLNEGPLQYLLSFKSMRWAWYILLAMVLVYVLFRAKRKQKPIPMIVPNNNTSLEFVQTMGRLYFLQNDHKNLCRLKMRQFLTFIRNKYHLPTSQVDNQLMQKISLKSQLPYHVVDGIFGQYNLIIKTSMMMEDTELIKFHQSIDNFYKNCK
jgi:lipopolysaccharide export system protein LptC